MSKQLKSGTTILLATAAIAVGWLSLGGMYWANAESGDRGRPAPRAAPRELASAPPAVEGATPPMARERVNVVSVAVERAPQHDVPSPAHDEALGEERQLALFAEQTFMAQNPSDPLTKNTEFKVSQVLDRHRGGGNEMSRLQCRGGLCRFELSSPSAAEHNKLTLDFGEYGTLSVGDAVDEQGRLMRTIYVYRAGAPLPYPAEGSEQVLPP